MNGSSQHAEVMVIGAGIVGLACAWHLQEKGFEVVLMDPEPPGSRASSGNAGIVANYAIEPLAQPLLWRDLPHLLLSTQSPFHLLWRHLPGLAPWLWRFFKASNRHNAQHATRVLSELLAPAVDDWQRIIADLEENSGVTLHRRGSLCFYRSEQRWRGAQREFTERERFGIAQERLDARALAALEPGLEGLAKGGILFPEACHLSDPLALAQSLAERLQNRGVRLLRAKALGLESLNGGGVGIDTDQGPWQAEKTVIAAGAWSRPLALNAGDRIPLISERGYHLEYPAARELVSRPCCPMEHAFYFTPMKGRLRIAGTVELGHNDDPANPARLDYIRRHAEALLGPLGEPSHSWLGLRPSLPDSLPVIGPASSLPGVSYAFGHGHLGLTLAATTGRLVAASLTGQAPAWLSACGAARFR